MSDEEITAETLLAAYASGYFPMAESREGDELYWFNPSRRGTLPLDRFNIPRGLRKVLRDNPFTMRIDSDFEGVIRACADMERGKDGTWINDEIIGLYCELHEMGHAHSVESWQDGKLVGGLYGVSLGGAFFGESMFSHVSEASKVALVYLVEVLREAGYSILDTQFVNDHLKQFGVKEIRKNSYITKLDKALNAEPNPSSLFSTVSVRKGLAS
ncbi:MAG: leucyl/phenylalanyl-tRNA--protein transferase [Rickettsiales bacterium]|nr:leucyl/phenylalanyl-tRNA--protein transferase [Rickettsiales bacterium]